MGKKNRDERREKREDYAASRSKNKRKTNLMAAGILALIALIVGYASYEFITMDANIPGAPSGAGKLGGEHEHASLLVRIFGDKFDFGAPSYQIKSSWIHFEESDGTTIHRHASGVARDKFDFSVFQVIKSKVVGFILKKVMVLQFTGMHQE